MLKYHRLIDSVSLIVKVLGDCCCQGGVSLVVTSCTSSHVRIMELSEQELAEAHQRYIEGQQPARIAFVLTHRRKQEGIEPVKTGQINSKAWQHKWGNERAVFLAAKSKTVAQALADLKETAALEMV